MFYDRFKQLADDKGLSVHKATQDIGLSKSTATKWKKTGATPAGETLSKIATYFDVSIDYLLKGDRELRLADSGKPTENAPAGSEGKDEKSEILDSINAMLGPGGAINFSASDVTVEDLLLLRDSIEANIQMIEKRIQRRNEGNE